MASSDRLAPNAGNGAPGAAEGAAALTAMPALEPAAAAVLDAIKRRRSYPFMAPDALPRDLIEILLDAANRAPNHHLTQPWRFFVFTGDARQRLGERFAAAAAQRESAGLEAPPRRRNWPETFRRAPVVIAAAAVPGDEHIPFWEEAAAVAAAVQNLLLAAHALGLAAIWRSSGTGPEATEVLGLPPGAQVLGYVYLGYPDPNGPPLRDKPRRSHTDFVQWMG
jgi:nitroreductase